MSTTGSTLRRVLVSGAVVAGAGLGAAGVASAATSTSTTPAVSSSGTSGTSGPPTAGSSAAPHAGAPDPATLTHGPVETLLTGTQLAQAAANAALPGATIVRAETNSSGDHPYEVQGKKSDGTHGTVELNSRFGVITTVTGFGAGPAGGQAPTGSSSAATATA